PLPARVAQRLGALSGQAGRVPGDRAQGDQGTRPGASGWMLAEVSKLVWGPPAPRSPLGKMDPEAFKRTADIAYRFGVIKKTADSAAYTHEIWEMAQKKPARSP